MLIPQDTGRRNYAVGGSLTSVFAIPFPFFSLADIFVSINGVDLAAVAYSVTGTGTLGEYTSGSVTLVTPVQNVTVTVRRETVAERILLLGTTGALDVAQLNREQSRFIALLQEMQAAVDRVLRVPDGDPLSSLVLPSAVARAGGFFAFDSNGEIVISAGVADVALSTFGASLGTAANAAAARTLLGTLGTSMPLGTAALPGLAFDTDSNTGFYRPAVDEIGFSTGGALRFRMSSSWVHSSVPVLLADGSLATPSVAFNSDTDTGLRRVSADKGAAVAGGADIATWAAAGLDVVAGALMVGGKPVPVLRRTNVALVNALDFTHVFTGAKAIELRFSGLRPDTDLTRLQLTLSTDGGATYNNTAGDYRWVVSGHISQNGGALGTFSGAIATSIYLSAGLDISNDASSGCLGRILIVPGVGSRRTRGTGQVVYELNFTPNYDAHLNLGFSFPPAANALRLAFSTGNIAEGDITIYEWS